MHERANCRKACITTPNLVVPFTFQIVEESQYQWGVEVSERESLGGLAQVALGKSQQKAKTVPVGGYSLRASISLLNQTFQEEPLEKRREAVCLVGSPHCVPPSMKAANRSAATAMISGVALTYQ